MLFVKRVHLCILQGIIFVTQNLTPPAPLPTHARDGHVRHPYLPIKPCLSIHIWCEDCVFELIMIKGICASSQNH